MFIINIIPIYVVVMVVAGRYSNRLYIAYSTFYALGSIMAMQARATAIALVNVVFLMFHTYLTLLPRVAGGACRWSYPPFSGGERRGGVRRDLYFILFSGFDFQYTI